jgi:hypothetical protein
MVLCVPGAFFPTIMLALPLFALLATTNAYIWPWPQLEALDEFRFEQLLADFINPCDLFIFDGGNSGRADSADWIRTVRAVLSYSDNQLISHRHTTTWRRTMSKTGPGAWTARSVS